MANKEVLTADERQFVTEVLRRDGIDVSDMPQEFWTQVDADAKRKQKLMVEQQVHQTMCRQAVSEATIYAVFFGMLGCGIGITVTDSSFAAGVFAFVTGGVMAVLAFNASMKRQMKKMQGK